jgi:hypothetical protein
VRGERFRGCGALWGKSNLAWLRKFLKLKAGAPSHDTFCRVLAMIDPAAFEAAFLRWVGVLVPALAPGSVVAIDGKTSRRVIVQSLRPNSGQGRQR